MITDAMAQVMQLIVASTLGETSWTLTRNAKRDLPILREVGNLSAHGRYFHPRFEDVERLRQPFRIVIEEMLHHAKLL